MTVQDLEHDVLQDEDFSEVRAFLAEHGLRPDEEEAMLAALRARGWDLDVEGMTGDWSVKIKESRAATQYQIAIAHDPDRRRALLRAVRLALSWLTSEQERDLFDRSTQSLMGMPAEEFMARWETGDLNPDDPRVRHLLMLRPVGW